MTRIRFALALTLLLLFAQQGAMLHELSHIYHTGTPHLRNAPGLDGKLCEACLGFSQVANPASGAMFEVPAIAVPHQVGRESQFSIIAADAPARRSRGPPVFL